MPVKERRLNFVVEPLLMDRIDEYRFSHKIGTLSDALRELLEDALDALDADKKMAARSSPSKAAMNLAKVYDGLDAFGKRAVNQTAKRERERVAAQRRPVTAREFQGEPIERSSIQPISVDEIESSDLDL